MMHERDLEAIPRCKLSRLVMSHVAGEVVLQRLQLLPKALDVIDNSFLSFRYQDQGDLRGGIELDIGVGAQ